MASRHTTVRSRVLVKHATMDVTCSHGRGFVNFWVSAVSATYGFGSCISILLFHYLPILGSFFRFIQRTLISEHTASQSPIMLRIWNLGRALGLLASSTSSESQALSTDVPHASIQTIHIGEDHSIPVTIPSVWATAQLNSAQERSIPIFIAAESPSLSTVLLEETVYVTVTVDVMPTSSRTLEHFWTTATTPCVHVDDAFFIKPTLPGKGRILARGADVSTVWVEETVYVTVTVDVLPTTSSTSQRSWTTATTPCAHDDHDSIIKPNPPGKRAVVLREPNVTTLVVEETVYVTTEEIVYVTVTADSKSVGLDLSSMVDNYNPTSTYTIEESVPIQTTTSVSLTTYEDATANLPASETAVLPRSSLSLVPPSIPHTSASTMKPEDAPGYWLKGGVVSTRGQAVHRGYAEPSSVTNGYTHDVHPTILANDWLGQFRNFARKAATIKKSTCVSTIPTLAAAPTSCFASDAEDQLAFENSLTKSNEAREWLHRLVQRSDTLAVAKRDIHTSAIRAWSLEDFPAGTVYQIIDDHDGTAAPTTWTTTRLFHSQDIDSSSTSSLGTATRNLYSTSTQLLQVSASSSETTLASWTRSTTIWPDSATSWSPSPTPTTTSLEWDWWKGTKYQQTVAAEKKVRSAAAAVEQKVEMSGWKRAENDVSPWVITFGVVLAALTFALM